MKKITLLCILGVLISCDNQFVSIGESANNYGKGAKSCLSEAMYFEARGTGYKGMRAVGEVLLNRSDDSRFPNSVCGSLKDRCQFSYRCDGKPEVYKEAEQKEIADKIATELLTNRQEDITDGALFFRAKWYPETGWWRSLSKRGTFGGNVFYR